MRRLLSILYVILSVFIFASCKDENSFMSVDDDNQPCYSILVSAPNNATRATYEENGENIAIKWEKGDVIYLGEDEFVFKEMRGDNGLFFHYGDITNANNWTGRVSFGSDPDTKDQVQKKNNTCCEHLVANVVESIDLRDVPTISLLPDKNMSLLHIQTKSPATFLKGSLLKIKGLWQDYSVTLGNTNDPVFVYKDDVLDVYVAVPGNKTIRETAAVKLYFYAYDENAEAGKDPQTNGDEYHYYMKCNAAITTKNNEVVKLPLPNKPTHVAIQMGLPSGTKWATMNVGATSDQPGEASFGRYFPWGMVEEHYEYAWNGVPCPLEGKNESALKEVFGSSFTSTIGFQGMSEIIYQGEKFGDAATYNWGDDWVTPSQSDVNELINNCTIQKSFSYDLEWAKENIVIPHAKTHGLYVISKNEKYKNKKIWFPAAGGVHNKYMGTIDSPASNDGSNGVYMTTTMATSNDKNFAGFVRMSFNSAPGSGLSTGCWIDGNPVWEFYRKHGSTVRPIRKK